MSKRSNGEGTIIKKPNGRWRAAVTIDGRRLYFSAATKRECEEWRKSLIDQVSRGLTLDGTRLTISDHIDTWYAIKQARLRPSTLDQYAVMIRVYIKPRLGSLTLKDLTPPVIQNFYTALLSDDVGKRTIEVTHTVLHGALKHAVNLGLIPSNPTDKVEVPRPQKEEMRVWDENQVNTFLISLDPLIQPFYRLAFATGMRKSELLGLHTDDINWAASTIKVTHQVIQLTGGGYRFQSPKTDRGRRTIRLGPGVMAALKYQLTEVIPLKKTLVTAQSWHENNLLFPSRFGTPLNGNNLAEDFGTLAINAGLPRIRFHDIRHTSASIMLMHNTPPVQVAYILGETLASLMHTYAHYIPGSDDFPAGIMDAITTPTSIDLTAIKVKK